MSLSDLLQHAATQVPECVAAGYVDVASGMLMAIKTVDSHPREVIDLIAAATAELFDGPNVRTIEAMFRQSRGRAEEERRYFSEIIINSDNLIHLFLRGRVHPDYVAVFVCRKSANLGMALTKARLALPELEATL